MDRHAATAAAEMPAVAVDIHSDEVDSDRETDSPRRTSWQQQAASRPTTVTRAVALTQSASHHLAGREEAAEEVAWRGGFTGDVCSSSCLRKRRT